MNFQLSTFNFQLKRGFTMIEILLVISLITILAGAVMIGTNPFKQIANAHDAARKKNLSILNKIFEDWYNDKNCYPKPSEICYNNSGNNNPCNICGSESTSPSLPSYMSELPCDPQHPNKQYLYQVDDTSCPAWYRIYTKLSVTSDPQITMVGCQNGCGPAPSYAYSYGVSSPNIALETNPTPTPSLTPTSTPIPTPTPEPCNPPQTNPHFIEQPPYSGNCIQINNCGFSDQFCL